MYDVIIIGGGPSGLSAALYLARKKMNILLVTKDFGGQISKSAHVENYPGIESISGTELSQKMLDQVNKLNVEIKNETVKDVHSLDNKFKVVLGESELETKAVIVASGKMPRKLGVPGEDQFLGKGVGYCAVCDGPLFTDKTVAVIGGGNSALDSALEMEKYAKKVYIVNLNNELQGDEILKERFGKSQKGEIINNAKTIGISGEQFVASLKYENTKTKEMAEIKVDGVFVEIGWEPATSYLEGKVILNNLKEIETDKLAATNIPGIFACGDVTNSPYKQIVIAAGEGATAALSAWKYVITHQ